MQKYAESLYQKGIKYLKKKDFINSEKCFEELKDIYSSNKDIIKNLSICYYYNGKYEDCEKNLEELFTLGHKDKDLIELFLLVLKKQDNIKKIIETISKEKKNINEKYELLEKYERPAIAMTKSELAYFRKTTEKKIELAISENILNLKIDEQIVDPPLFYYSYENKDNLELSKKLHQLFFNSYPELQKKISLNNLKNKKIKIGFISQFFKSHTISKLFKGLILNLDSTLFDKNIFYLDKGKGVDKEFFENESNNQLKIFKLPKSFKDKTNVIINQNLDIILYPDIGLSTQLYYLTFLKLAKYQLTSWGHPETTGNPNIDFFLSSKFLEVDYSEAQKHYSEKLLLCDYLPMFYSKPKIKRIEDSEIQSNNIYSCPQTLFKLHPDFDEIIFKILQDDSKAKIFFIKGKELSFSRKIYDRLSKKISDKMNRVIFIDNLSNEEYINHCGRASVLLDPLYFGAGNSFHESMFYGTATVTMPTKYLKSKIVEGAYKQMKIDNPPVVTNINEYVSLAVEIANTSPKKLLERKKYYAECAEKNLFENNEALKSFQNILINIVK